MGNIIYKATNKLTNQSYIGCSTNGLGERKLDHIERAERGEKGKFYEAIATHGTDAFEWTEIDTANTTDQLAELEVFYIDFYKTKEYGYNANRGGGFQKTVYQYCKQTGKLLNEYTSLEEASQASGSSRKSISNICLGYNKSTGGYYWSYQKKSNLNIKDSRKKEVIQLTRDNQLIQSYSSIAEASRKTGIHKSSIAKACRKERNLAGGYKWTSW